MSLAGALQAGDVLLGIRHLDRILLLIDFAQNRTFAEIEFRFAQVRLRRLQFGKPFLHIAGMFGSLLFHLMGEIVVFSRSFARRFYLRGIVEFGQYVTLVNTRAILCQLDQRELAALPLHDRNPHHQRMRRLDRSRCPDNVRPVVLWPIGSPQKEKTRKQRRS